MRFATTVALGCILLCLGCGEDGSGDSSDKMADCADVWIEGAQLPKDYEGCTEGSVVIVPDILECNDDGGKWTMYDHRLWAVLGEDITKLPSVPDSEPSQTGIILSCE